LLCVNTNRSHTVLMVKGYRNNPTLKTSGYPPLSFRYPPMLRVSTKIRQLRRPRSHRRQLPFPAVPTLRVAQLGSAATAFDSVEAFPRERWNELESFRPHVLVGSPSDLRRVAELSQRGILDLESIDHAMFALTRCGDQPLSDVSRVVLWQAFGVPLYELFV